MSGQKGEPSKAVRDRVEETGPCVVLLGGERDGWWYRLDDWQVMREAAQHALSRGQRLVDNITGYAPTSEYRDSALERFEGLRAQVWRWNA